MNIMDEEGKMRLDKLGLYLTEANKEHTSFTCTFSNLTSVLLKHINILVLNDRSEKRRNESNSLPNLNASFDALPNLGEAVNTGSVLSTSIRDDYDYDGALFYILFILFWYGFFVILLIIIQTKMSHMDQFEFSDDPRGL